MSAGDTCRQWRDGRALASQTTKTPYTGEPKGAYRPKEFETRYCIGHTKLYEEIGAGRLIARKAGGATIILHEDAEAWARALPAIEPTEAVHNMRPVHRRNRHVSTRAIQTVVKGREQEVLRSLDKIRLAAPGSRPCPRP